MHLKIPYFNLISTVVLLVFTWPISLHSFDTSMVNITNTIQKDMVDIQDMVASGSSESAGSGAAGSCGSCRMRDAFRTLSLEIIKQQILLRLGMHSALNTTGRKLPEVPQEVLAQYPNLAVSGMLSDQPVPAPQPWSRYNVMEEEDNLHIKTEKIVIFSKPCPKLRHSWRTHNTGGAGIQFFQFSENVTRNRVKAATLYVWLRGSGTTRPSTRDLHVRVLRVTTSGFQQRGAATVRQSIGEGRWLKLDASVMVSEWFKNPKDNLGFVINATTINGEKIVVTDSAVDNGIHVPFVDIEITDTRKRRTKRTIGLNCNEDEQQTLCCRYPLTVDFEEFGWDFIIAPKRYEANYCAGECPFMTFQKYAHTHLVKMTNQSTSGPCCAPRKLSAISMLYFDQELNIIYGSLPGMVVDRCGCS